MKVQGTGDDMRNVQPPKQRIASLTHAVMS